MSYQNNSSDTFSYQHEIFVDYKVSRGLCNNTLPEFMACACTCIYMEPVERPWISVQYDYEICLFR